MKTSNPFSGLTDAMEAAGAKPYEAVLTVQSRMDAFVNEKTSLMQRFDIESNEASRQATTALITLSTVLLPLVALVFSQEKLMNILSLPQKIVVLSIIFLLFTSIIFGVFSHWSGGRFFKKWASGTQESLKFTDENLKNMQSLKELYSTYDQKMVELGLIEKDQKGTTTSTRKWDYLQFATVVTAGFLIVLLMYTLLFDVPGWKN